MFGISKSAKKKKQNDQDTINANNFLESNIKDTKNDNEIKTKLSIPSDWKVPNEERYIYAFHNNQSPKLMINQVSIYGMDLTRLKNNSFVASGFIRNTVQHNIKFGNTSILLFGPNKEVIAKKEFDLSKLGVIPANSARPWKFIFSSKDVVNDIKMPIDEWSLAFELKKKHELELEESWENSIAEEAKNSLQEIVAKAAPLKPGEVNFMGIEAKQKDNGDMIVTILIRNGTDKNISLHQIPLGVKDASNEEIAKGNFKLDDFTIKANTSKPWTFVFPSSVITKEEINLSTWKVYPLK